MGSVVKAGMGMVSATVRRGAENSVIARIGVVSGIARIS